MSTTGTKANQIFALRDELTPSEETLKAMDALKADPTDPEKYMQLGLCLRRQAFFREAIEAYSTGLTYQPFHCLLYRHRGHAYVNIGLYRQAAADFEIGLRIDPMNWDCWYHLGLSYHLMGEYERALKAYYRAYDVSVSDKYRICATDWLCLTLMKMGRLDEMRAAAARITPDMIPTSASTEAYFTRVLVYNGNNSADKVLSEAEARDDHMFATYTYGLAVWFEYVTGEKEKAERILKRIAARDETWYGFAEHAAADKLSGRAK